MGTGTSSGMARGGGTSAAKLSDSAMRKAISQAKYEDAGNGQWTFDIDGVGGVQILDETGSSRDPYHGMGGKVYGVTLWTYDRQGTATAYNPIIMQGSIGQAKTAGKQNLKKLLYL